MSAFMCSDEHVNRILDAARLVTRHEDLMHYLRDVPGDLLSERLTAVGRMMHRENMRSVLARYDVDVLDNGEALEYEQQVTGFVFVAGGDQQTRPTPVEGLKLIASWRYQSCEHDQQTRHAETWDLVELVERMLIGALPGYEAAAWSV